MLLLSLLIAVNAAAPPCSVHIATYHGQLDAIERVHSARTFANTVLPLELATSALNAYNDRCSQQILTLEATEFARPKLYAALVAVPLPKNAMDAALTKRWIVKMKRAGAALTPERRNELFGIERSLGAIANIDRAASKSYVASLMDRKAHLLGYETYEDYIDADRAAQNPMRVEKFVHAVEAIVKPAADAQERELKEVFAASQGRRKRTMQPGDIPQAKLLLEKRFGIDESQLRQWFPAEGTRAKIFALFGTLFGVTITQTNEVGWSPDVQTFAVADAASRRRIGTMYVDIIPTGAPVETSTVVPGHVVAITGAQSATLTHSDVVDFFHATGEALRQLLAATPYETLNSDVPDDFASVPAQLSESFAWNVDALRQVASDRGADPLPEPLLEQVAASRTLLAAYDAQHAYDVQGYEALWSRVYADDLFTAFSSGNVLDPAIGARFRATVLAPAGALAADTEVQDFLGRPMSPDAFYKELAP